jgi:hypothetical protein
MVKAMELNHWSDPRYVLGSTLAVLQAPLGDLLDQLSPVLAGLLPHRALAMLTGDCSRHPLRTHGEAALTEKVTSTELARLAGTVGVGAPWFGPAHLSGASRPVLAVVSAPAGSSGALLVVVPADGTPPTDMVRELVQHLWDLITLQVTERAAAADPAPLADSRVAASERARAIGELTDAHSAILTSLLGALRSRTLDDATARRTATDIAVSALIELRAAGDLDRALNEEAAEDAFARLADRLSPLTRYSEVSLQLIGPQQRDRSIPADIANAARAVVRGTVLTMLTRVTSAGSGWPGVSRRPNCASPCATTARASSRRTLSRSIASPTGSPRSTARWLWTRSLNGVPP